MAEKRPILLVEDEASIADTIAYALETEAFACTWTTTATEALDHIAATHFALIILDVGLPDMDGFELCKRIRQQTDTPIVFLTARDDVIDRVVGLELGGDDYMVKPFSPRELTARVKAILRRQSTTDNHTMAGDAGPMVIDPHRMKAMYAGTELALSPVEFRLLSALAERPGWVLSREQLMAMAWDDPGSSQARTVDAHVKSLRAKFRQVRQAPNPIITHRGTGYSLRDNW